MKKIIYSLFGLAIIIGGCFISNVNADVIPTLNAWVTGTGNTITTRSATSTVKIPALASSNLCVATNASGTLISVTCGTTGAATTTISGVSGPTFTFNTGTTGSDFRIATSTGIITFNLPTASSSTRGALSSTDWSTFNAKQPAGSYLTTTTGNWLGTWQSNNPSDFLASTTNYFKVDQTSPQTVINGTPIFNVGLKSNAVIESNLNTVAGPASLTGTAMKIVGADNSVVRFGLSSFGAAGIGAYAQRHARNTAAAPQAVQSGDTLMSLEGWGYGTTDYSSAPRVMVRGYADETWTDTKQSSRFSIWTTPTDSVVPAERFKISQAGVINIPGLTASKVVFTDASSNLTSTGLGTSAQFIKGDGSLDSSTYLTDAPSDGTTYGRKNAAWQAISAGGGDVSWGGNTNGVKKTLGSIDNYGIGFITNNTEKLSILANGNVGIGTTNPSAKLEILASSGAGIKVGRVTGNSSILGTGDFLAIDSGPGAMVLNHYTTQNIYLVYSGVGNVGIGAQNTGSKLGVTGNLSVGSSYGILAAPAGGVIIEGNVGVGTTNPGAKLQVSAAGGTPSLSNFTGGAGVFHDTTTNVYTIIGGIDVSPYTNWIQVNGNNGFAYPLALQPAGGNVGIGTTAPAAGFHASGTLRFDLGSDNYGDLLSRDTTNNIARVAPNTSGTLKFLSQFGDGTGGYTPTWQTVPMNGNYTYFLENASSTPTTYKLMTSAYTPLVAASISTALSAATTTLMTWATASSTPNLSIIPAGLWRFHLDAARTAGSKLTKVYADIYKFNGVTETLLFSTQLSDPITVSDSVNIQEIDIEAAEISVTLANTDRILIRWYGVISGAGSNPTLLIAYQGATQARVEFPSATVSADNFVPYTGATKNVDLSSAFNITAKNFITSGGASSQFVKGDGSLDGSTYLTAVTSHNLLSSTHGDTTAASVVKGDLITGQGATPKWARLAFPASPTGKLLQASATDVLWSTNPLTIGTSASVSGSNTGDQIVPANEGGSANNFLTAYNSSTGAWTKAQPAQSNISGLTTSDSPSFTGLTSTGAAGITLGTKTTTNIPGTAKFIAAGSNSAYYTTLTAGTNTGNTTITLPTANPGGTYILNMTSGGVMGYDSNSYLTSVTAHNLLSTTHGDTLADNVVRGDILIGNSTPKWARLAKGSNGQFLTLNATDVLWSTATLPPTATGTGKILVADGTNWVASTPTFPNASATTGKIIKSDGTNWVASTETFAAPGTSGNVLTSNGTNWTSAAPAVSGAFWTAVTGSPVRDSNTSFTVTGDQTARYAKGVVLKWTESSTVRNAFVSIPATYSAPTTTVTIVGDTMASIDASSLEYASAGVEQFLERFTVAGTIGTTTNDVSNAYYAREPMRVLGSEMQVGTVAATSGTTTVSLVNGTGTVTLSSPLLAYNVASTATPSAPAASALSLALGNRVQLNITTVTATTFPVDLYVQLYLWPTRLNNLN